MIRQDLQRVEAHVLQLLLRLLGFLGGLGVLLLRGGQVVHGVRGRAHGPRGARRDVLPVLPGRLPSEDVSNGLRHLVGQAGDGCQHLGHRVQNGQEDGPDGPHGLPELFLDVAHDVAELLHASCWCCGKRGVHSAHRLLYHLRQHSGTLRLVTVLQDLLLCFVEGVAVPAQGVDLAVHDLAQHGGDGGGLLRRGVVAVLLRGHVVHDGDQGLQGIGQAQIGGKLLRAGQLYLVSHNAEGLLRAGEIQNALDLVVGGAHGVAHDLGELDLALRLRVIGCRRLLAEVDDGSHAQPDAQGAEGLLQAAQRRAHAVAGLCDAGLHRLHGARRFVRLFRDRAEVRSRADH